MKKNLVVSFLLLLGLSISVPVFAAAITGGAGFNLGDRFDPAKSANQKLTQDGAVVYRVKPAQSTKNISHVLLRLTGNQRIHRITVFSVEMSPAKCHTEVTAARKSVEKQYPGLGYYAMDDAEMFYEEPRTLTIECVQTGTRNQLKTEYSDDALAKFKVK